MARIEGKMKQQFRLISPTVRQNAMQAVSDAPDGYVCEVRPETRRDAQNRLLWPLIKDVKDHCDPDNLWTPDQWKLRFLNELDNEMSMIPCLYGGGSFVVGQRSSLLSVKEFSDLCEIIFAYGALHNVEWSSRI